MSGCSVLRSFAFLCGLPSVNRRVLRSMGAVLPFLLLAAVVRPAHGAAVRIEHCNNPTHTLPAGDKDTDLQVTNGINCIVDGRTANGTYLYRNVNIWNGALTFRDAKIDFHAHSILVENGGTLDAGFESPAVGPITLWLYGARGDGIPSIRCQSGDTCGVPNDIWKSNRNVVMKEMPHGCVSAASPGFPPSPVGKDCFYQYEKLDDDDGDGAFFGRKVLAVSYGGTLLLRGRKGIRTGPVAADPSDSGTSWVRLTDTLNPDNRSFHVDRPVPTWGSGDHLVLTSTDYLPGHSEEVVIESVRSDGKGAEITLERGVQYPHYGKAYDFSDVNKIPASSGPKDDPNGPKTLPSRHIETRAAVALLTRSIMIASEGAEPVLEDRSVPHFPQGFYGGQTVVRQGVKQFQIQGVEYYQLGQGGAIGRYPVHFHMDRTVPQPTVEPPFQGTYIADSSIHDSNTRFITIHATQGLLVARNVGYQSIGHGFYLEDATEINNRLYSNIGIEARAAVDDDLNPRKVPGILSRPGAGEDFPFRSDVDHPSVFWIMNTWNDFRYNVAVGAGTCGACYWMPPSANSGSSVYESWDSYASAQTPGREGSAPFLNFVGNSCSTAMTAIQTVGDTAACLGVRSDGSSDSAYLNAIPNPEPTPENKYPVVGKGQREHATLCDAAHQEDCSKVNICTGSGPNEAQCAATVIDHFTSSFTWAQKNFASVWLRGWWFLVTDSAITDAQSGGLTFVTGGGYTRADAAQGYWSLSHRNIFVGNTQPNTSDGLPANAAASNAGPFNPRALTCAYNPQFCISAANDIAFQNEFFNGGQRLLNIYDGPSFEDSDAFADVHTTTVGTLGECKPGGNDAAGSCSTLKWMNAYTPGVMQKPATNKPSNACILPNAAIAWKQPNGFYYPPAFHSTHLAFSDVDIRHFVVQPLWLPNSFEQDPQATRKTYCTWESGQFSNFTDVDRQTELSDDNGSLTGLTSNTEGTKEPSISVTRDPFFNAPLVTPECASSVPELTATVDTSPYQYVTTALYTPCGAPGGSCDVAPKTWGFECTSQSCYGIPLYRQFLTDQEFDAFKIDAATRPEIRMMGQGTGQRSNMTLNHGSYYIDTTVPLDDQKVPNPNVFLADHSYYLYFLYATQQFHQTYSMYIGKVSEQEGLNAVTAGRVNVDSAPYKFIADSGANWITKKNYDPRTGLLTITVDLSQQGGEFAKDRPDFCQPQSYCSYKPATRSCGCRPGSNCKEDSVCNWAVKDLDCPIAGCFGLSIKMPDKFVAEKQPGLPPAPTRFIGDPDSDPFFRTGNVTFQNASSQVAGSCYYSVPPMQH
ncbi:MAG TPA: G8 domain-containing protein [Acidobacteriaceae bacterium]|nr:G8 domain-containing protein [Acidobacteriaceae bacterium]